MVWLTLAVICVFAAACTSSSNSNSAQIFPEAAETQIKQIILQPADAGTDFTQGQAIAQTNDDLAKARPDTDGARRQYADWGQVLQYNVQYSAPVAPDLVFSGKIARVTNTATLFVATDGAAAALTYTRGLPASTVANFLVNDAGGTTISDTQIVKDIAFPARGDESFAWRITGKATFPDGFTVIFVAEAVFVRAGRVNGNVTAIAFGQAPKRGDVIALVDTFVERARAPG